MLNRLIDVARNNRFGVVVVYLGLAGWGWWALTSTPIDAIPDLSGNRTIVFTDCLLQVLVVTLVICLWIRERRLGRQSEPPPRHQGGRVKVTSAGSCAGSEFVVSLPVSPADAPDNRRSENVGQASAPFVASRGRRVMVVDDHEEIRVSIARLARGWGHETAVAADGSSALSLAEAFQPERAIVDLSMPGMNGIDLARRLRQRFPPTQLRLIALSTYADADIRDACLAAGFDAYLVKPGEIAELEELLGRDSPAPRRHEILFCSDDAAIVDGFTRFIAAALNAADGAIALVTDSHRARLLQALRTQGVDVDGAIERGTQLSFDADVAPDPVRFLEAINGVRKAAARAGKLHPRVAFCGERAGRLCAAGRTAEAVQLEQLCSGLAHDVDILCAYPVPYTKDDQVLTRICAEHTAVSAR